MQVDYAVELGREDPALEVPWQSEDGATSYRNLKSHPDLVCQIPEAANLPELRGFLTRINQQSFPLQTAKCDAWYIRELSPEEEIFNAQGKFVSYVDLVFADTAPRISLEKHEVLAKKLCELLDRAPAMQAAIEFIIRRCYFHPDANLDESTDGFSITAYVSGYGHDETEARLHWSIALTLLQHALVQVAR